MTQRARLRSVVYQVEAPSGQPVVRWVGECDLTADDIGAKIGRGTDGARDNAAEFLRALLGKGPVSADQVKEMASAARISEATLRRAKQSLGVNTRKVGYAESSWVWELPQPSRSEGAHEGPEGAHG